MKVSADGAGVVSHAGVGLLREVADLTGLSSQVTEVLADTYRGPWTHAPGGVFADLAAAVADGADCVDSVGSLWGDRQQVFGPVASTTTLWRLVDERVDAAHLPGIRAARAHARERAWAAGAAPDHRGWLHLDVDATICIDHSDNKENAAATWKKTFGFHPLLSYLDRPDISGGEGLAGILRPGNAGSNTTADHIRILQMSLVALPDHARPVPGKKRSPKVLIRTDSAGATYGFAAACRDAGCNFSFGFAIDETVRAAILQLHKRAWTPAYDINGEPRDGAWVAELTGLLDLSKWPTGSRVLVRKERPHPGAQLRFTDADGHRFTAFITDAKRGGPKAQHADLEVRHRSHARVEDRIRCGKSTGLRNMPCKTFAMNRVWLELALAAADLMSWTQKLCLDRELATCEPAALRYRLLHVAARLVHTGRRWHLKLDRDWPWAEDLANAFARLRAAPWPP
jgi:hypothetical protein